MDTSTIVIVLLANYKMIANIGFYQQDLICAYQVSLTLKNNKWTLYDQAFHKLIVNSHYTFSSAT